MPGDMSRGSFSRLVKQEFQEVGLIRQRQGRCMLQVFVAAVGELFCCQIQQASPTWQEEKLRQTYVKGKVEPFFDPFDCEDVDIAQQIQESTTYLQEGVNLPLFQSIK